MLRTLRTILEKPRSVLNTAKIRAIDGCYLDNEILHQFRTWGKDPTAFWESPVEAVPAYSGLARTNERLRAFFSGALVLGFELKIRRIQWRFVTIVAHRHFTRKHPTAKLQTDKVRDFLSELGLETSHANVSRCHDIITSGKRRTEFCQRLQAVSVEQAQTDRDENERPVNYGPMFMSSIPDDLWDNKNGFSGSTADDCFAHLLSLEAGTWITDVGCESLAKRLIAFHDHLIWRDGIPAQVEGRQLATNQWLPGNFPNNTPLPQPTHPSLGRVVATMNSPWQHLLSAAESATSQAQLTDGGHQPNYGVDAFPLTATNQQNGSQAQDTTAGNYGAFSKSGFTQPVVQLPPVTSFVNPESWRGDHDKADGTTSILSASSHAENGPAMSETFANTTANEAITVDDIFVLWQNSAAGAFSQDPSSYSFNDQNLLSSCDDAQLQW